ncbi:Na+/H+ antiporter NhaA [Canibacter zhoujuaniae]|uniref:Na+/H+ antiporter NhaA n=1 Tax=Canibacter zhoujuaniae TaxID=2708343 RepID=UPI001421D5AD|nr:Na+/H+ antiporter NhaA [Canibacter zhoujuaniae]
MAETTQHVESAPSQQSRRRRILRLARKREVNRVGKLLRSQMIGGLIIMGAALLGFILANSPAADWFFNLRGTYIGPEELGLRLSVGHWAADGLLAIFFFLVGLELKHEFVHGELRKFSTAIVPIAAAFGGVATPALFYLAFNFGQPSAHGWAIPGATDIAFAVAVLGLIAPGVPTALRMFLLTLAVVDDLIAILIIALFYTSEIQLWALAAAAVPILIYAFLTQKFTKFFDEHHWLAWFLLLPLGVVAWAFFLISGVHATIAGVILGFTVPVKGKHGLNLAERLAYRFTPLSAGIAVPVFAFFSAGVSIHGEARFPFDPIALGVIAGLVLGKPIGITLTTWLVTRFNGANLDDSITWRQLIGVASLAGIGFTVALLIAELSFTDPADQDTARLAVMCASLLAVGLASILLYQPKKQRQAAVERNEKQLSELQDD